VISRTIGSLASTQPEGAGRYHHCSTCVELFQPVSSGGDQEVAANNIQLG
jgi:hypothetical protein